MAEMKRRYGRLADETGAELIEFAIVFPVFLLVLMGIIDFGLLFQRYEVVTNAAREGARVAILPGYLDEDVEFRVNQYLTAAGLTATAETLVGTPVALPISETQCITVRPVTVNYPHSYYVVGQLMNYFGPGMSRTGLTATVSMRTEIPAAGCP